MSLNKKMEPKKKDDTKISIVAPKAPEQKYYTLLDGIGGIDWPRNLIIIGQTQSGKTTLLAHIVYHYSERGTWNKIYLFCPTYGPSSIYAKIFDEKYIYKEPTDDDVVAVLDTNRKINEKIEDRSRKRRILLIFDDCMGYLNFKNNELYKSLFATERHNEVSCIVIFQHFPELPPALRANISQLFILAITSTSIDKAYDCYRGSMSKREFKEYVGRVCQNYAALRINLLGDSEFPYLPFRQPNIVKNDLRRISQ